MTVTLSKRRELFTLRFMSGRDLDPRVVAGLRTLEAGSDTGVEGIPANSRVRLDHLLSVAYGELLLDYIQN